MEKMLNSAMAQEEIDKLIARKNEIVDLVSEKRSAFEQSDVETRDGLLNEVETLTKESEDLEEQIKDLEEQRATLKEQEERMALTKTLEKTEEKKEERKMENFESSKEYTKLYADYIRSNNETDIKAYLRSANISTGLTNVPIPTIMQGYVETAWAKFGKFSRLVASTEVPAIFKIPVESAADDAVWHTENAEAPAEESITLGQIVLQPKMIKKHIGLTDEIMAMGDDEFLRYVADELVYRVVKALDDAIITRTDANGLGVIGIANNTNTESTSAELGFNVINEAVAKLNVFDGLTIAMNPTTFYKNFMGLTDTVGNPIFRVVQDNTGKAQYYISGFRVEFTNALKAYDSCEANDVYAIVGNFERGYRCNYPQGRNVITLVDPYTLATEDIVRMIGRLYVAGNVVKLKHFSQLKKPAPASI